MVGEYFSSGPFLVELLVEEVGQMETFQTLVGLLEEEVVVVELEVEEDQGWTGQDQEELNHHQSQEVLLEHWSPNKRNEDCEAGIFGNCYSVR